jgi:periplasmic protein TonB
MKLVIALLALPLILGIAIAQSQPPATAIAKPSDTPGETAAEHVYGRKDGVEPPKITYSRYPEYPTRNSGKEGTVVLSLVVGSNGLPREITVARSLAPDLDQAAIEAVKEWKFAPGTKDGRPVASRIDVAVQSKHF